jgi:hypothetical protein
LAASVEGGDCLVDLAPFAHLSSAKHHVRHAGSWLSSRDRRLHADPITVLLGCGEPQSPYLSRAMFSATILPAVSPSATATWNGRTLPPR